MPRVLIIGGGVAGLETALALHQLAPEQAEVLLVAAEPEFMFKPMVVAEPFSLQPAERRDLALTLPKIGARFEPGALVSVDPEAHTAELAGGGEELSYDMLVVAVGGRARPAYDQGETFWAGRSDLPIDTLLKEAADTPSRTLLFVVPPGTSWPLPLYELALMTRSRVEERGPEGIALKIFTPESSPLGVFGSVPSEAVAELLRVRGIEVETDVNVVEAPGTGLHVIPGGGSIEAGPLVALPAIVGPAIKGLPADDAGFIPIDRHARVRGVDDVYAAGDGTDFPIKQGGIATQQADAAAEHIAARLGSAVKPREFEPTLRGQLITGAESLHLKHELAGGHGEGGASLDYLWWPPGKIAGRYLGPWLAGTTPDEGLEPPARPLEVEVSLPHEWHGDFV